MEFLSRTNVDETINRNESVRVKCVKFGEQLLNEVSIVTSKHANSSVNQWIVMFAPYSFYKTEK